MDLLYHRNGIRAGMHSLLCKLPADKLKTNAISVKNTSSSQEFSPWRMSVAPMMDWTDRHCRYLHRLLTRHTLLYTEMVTTGALIHGDVARHLRFNAEEHPVALQLGGSEPADLAHCARLGEQWGYDEINLNCGCPSERVQRGAFGACLMNEPQLVADCVKAMVDVVRVPVTVKHRIGIDKNEDYGFVRDFVGTVAGAGCTTFIVHARNAWLKGLSPKENREIPPLRYDVARQLKADFPHLSIAVNGGLATDEAVLAQLAQVDGVMVGREAYHNPWWLARWDALYYGEAPSQLTREEVEAAMVEYMAREAAAHGTPWSSIARHMLGLRHGLPGARRWRQVWSDHRLKSLPAHEVMALAQGGQGLANGAGTPPESQDCMP
jgi:tRNA-dihydrouridine synthase A